MSTTSAKPVPDTPGRITLIRHGTTEWSRTGRHTGNTDLPLLPEGETEAKALRASLSRLSPPADPVLVLTSPMQRARQTCAIAGFGAEMVTEPLLAEWDYGEYEGLTTPEIHAASPGWDLFRDGCPGGEAPEAVARRADLLLDRLRSDAALRGREVMLFSHGHFSRLLLTCWVSLEVAKARHFELHAGCFGRLAWENGWPTVERWNC